MTVEELKEQLEGLVARYDHEIERLRAVTPIQNVMAHYETIHITPDEIWRTPECFALWRNDVSAEVSDWGRFVGPDAVKGFWESQKAPSTKGAIFFHALATPCIQVAGDGKTAKVTWASPGFETMPPLGDKTEYESFWCWGKYACDFIKNPETGEWRIWHFKWLRAIRNNFYKSWYDDAKNTLRGMPSGGFEHPGRRPSVFHRPYSVDETPHPFPIDPQPYETYDGSFRWPYGGPEYKKKYNVNYPEY